MKKRKISLLLLSTAIIISFNAMPVKAFQPIAHCELIKSIGNKLPKDSIIAQSIKAYPEIANWGANGLDLGYLQPGQPLDRAPWADRYHYYKVGTFSKEQLQEAIKSKDMKKIAFASGWVSHITGDLACHGEFVNEECGVYMVNPDLRPLHKKLENNAEAYVFTEIAGNPIENYNSTNISNKFKGLGDIPFDLTNEISKRVYGEAPSTAEEQLWCTTLSVGLKTGVGYNYANINEAKSVLSENNREERLKRAFSDAEKHGVKLLKEAEAGDYSGFTDRWNLDVGRSESPISSLTLIVETGSKFLAGTDDDVYVSMELNNGKVKEWKLDKKNYNDFEYGDCDEYYIYVNDLDFNPKDIVKTSINKRNGSSPASDWYLKSFKVNINGNEVLNKSVNKWIDSNKSKEEIDVNWSNVQNTSDPKID